MKKACLFLVLFTIGVLCKAQDINLDSLIAILKTMPEDTGKLILLEQLADNAPDGEWQKYSEEMGSLAEKLMKRGQPLVKLSGEKYYAVWMNNKAYQYAENGNYKAALDYYTKCVSIQEKIGDNEHLSNSLNAIGAIFDRDGDLENAMINYDRALKIQESIGDFATMAATLNNIGKVYSNMGIKSDIKNNFSKALDYFQRALTIVENSKTSNQIAPMLYANLGDIMVKLENFPKASEYYKKGLEIAEETGDKNGKAKNLKGMGFVYFRQGENKKALELTQLSLSIASKSGYPRGVIDASELLKSIFQKQSNYKEAFEMQGLESRMKDSLANTENKKAVLKHKLQYEFDLKEATAKAEQEKKDALATTEIQKQKIQKYSFFIGAILLLLLASAYYYRYRFKKKVNKQLEEKNEVITKSFDELKNTQLQLVHQEKMASLGQLTAGIAHEINNPINFVSANIAPLKRDLDEVIELIQKYLIVDEHNYKNKLAEIAKYRDDMDLDYVIGEMKSLINGIEEGSKRTSEIVKGLRNFTRLEEGEIKRANMNEGLESTLVLLNNKLNLSNVEVIKAYGDIPEIDCYPGQINQVFMNVISNAIDAMDKNGKIIITTSGEKDRVKISIKDNGQGMTDAVKQKIFDPFFTTKDVGKGTGLGLSISFGIIDKHKGKFEVNSAVGKGTEFIITLPIHRVKRA